MFSDDKNMCKLNYATPVLELANSGLKSAFLKNSESIVIVRLQNLEIWLYTRASSMHLNTHLCAHIDKPLGSQCKLLGFIYFILSFKTLLGPWP